MISAAMKGRDSDSDLHVRATARGASFGVKVTPKARKPGVLGVRGGRIAVAVTAPPEKGKATQETIERVASWLGLKPGGLMLIAGATSRDKRFLAVGIDASDLRKRIEEASAKGGSRIG
jgi:uncharacterized protein YggU (UPF0235/DUF167 family)